MNYPAASGRSIKGYNPGKFFAAEWRGMCPKWNQKTLCITYQGAQGLDYGQYKIGAVKVNGQEMTVEIVPGGVKIRRAVLESLPEQVEIGVELVAG